KKVEEKYESQGRPESPNFTIRERPTSKDYRSFAANMFGTVAFKMLEWLTPTAMEDMSDKARSFDEDRQVKPKPAPPKVIKITKSGDKSSTPQSTTPS